MDEVFFSLVGLICVSLVLILPVAATVLAWQASSQLQLLKRRVLDLETDLDTLRRRTLALTQHPPQQHRALPEAPEVVAEEPAAEAPEVVAEAPEVVAEEPAAEAPADIASQAPPPVKLVSGPPPMPEEEEEEEEYVPRVASWSFERIAVWLAAAGGGGAVVLAGLYFFALAIQEGWVSPAARYALGLGVGAAMVGGAELLWSRRYRVPAAGVSGAGIGVLYGALYAGVELYELLPHSATFVLMALVTVTATALSNRHKSRFLSVLGALGGFATPLLLSTGDNRAVALFTYLAILDIGLLYTARRQRWWGLAVLASALTLLFQLGWGIQFHEADQLPIALLAATGIGGMFLAASAGEEIDTPMAWAMLGGGLGVLLLGPTMFLVPMGSEVTAAGGLPAALWILGASAGVLLLTIRRDWMFGAVAAAGMLAIPQLVFTLGWAGLAEPPRLAILAVVVLPAAFAWLVSARRSVAPALVAYLVALGCGLLVLVADEGIDAAGAIMVWPVAAQLGGLVALGLALSLRERGDAAMPAALGYAALALAGVSWMWADEGAGLVLLLLSGLAWAVFTALPFALAASRRQPGVLSWSASALAGVVFFLPMYLGWRDGIGDVLLGALPLVLGAGALVGVGLRVRDEAPDNDLPLALYAGATLMFASLVLPLQVEEEWLTIGWSLEVAGLAWLSQRLRHPLIPVTAGILAVMVCGLLLLNPAALDYHGLDGPVLFNWILYTWGVPAAALLYAARPLSQRYPALSVSLLLGGVALLFALINLEVAHAFSEGGELSFWSDDLFEEMTRSISWAAFGIALLLAGLAGSNRLLRVLAFLFLLLSAGKVFLIDLWSLSGLARVGSIMGLGVFLLFAALLFQRVVLREEKDSGEDA